MYRKNSFVLMICELFMECYAIFVTCFNFILITIRSFNSHYWHGSTFLELYLKAIFYSRKNFPGKERTGTEQKTMENFLKVDNSLKSEK